ncbi:MAG: hypothetical protein M3437_01770 [Chloroflexota bacterium]|nr:hypothetical protein [Chloroflexota bacterium]MDQ5865173.1 hypothetical protein [Chloroflexota bacterium]
MSQDPVSNHPQQHSDSQKDARLQVILAEVSHEEASVTNSIGDINQTLTLYIAVMAFLTPVAAGVLAFNTLPDTTVALVLGLIASVSATATLFTLLRTVRARIDHIGAERALSRLRNFFLANYPDIAQYTHGEHFDDWPTPYTHRWVSLNFYAWLLLLVVTGVFGGLASVAFLLAINSQLPLWFAGGLGLVVALLISGLCYRWLDSRLEYARVNDKPRFPRPTPWR